MQKLFPLMLLITATFIIPLKAQNICDNLDNPDLIYMLPPHVPGEILIEFAPGIVSHAWLMGEEPELPETGPETGYGHGKPGGFTPPEGGTVLGGPRPSETDTGTDINDGGRNPILTSSNGIGHQMFANKLAYIQLIKNLPKGQMVRLMPNISPANTHSTARNGNQVAVPPVWNMFVYKLTPQFKSTENMLEVYCQLKSSPYVQKVSLNIIIEQQPFTVLTDDIPPPCSYCDDIIDDEKVILLNGCDRFFVDQLSFENCSVAPTSTSPGDVDIDVNQAWEYTTGNFNTRIGIIGSGVQYDENEDFFTFTSGFQDVGSDYKIDGWNYIYNGEENAPGWNYDEGPAYPYETDNVNGSFHGTPITSLIGGRSGNQVGVAGIAGGVYVDDGSPEQLGAQLVVLKVGHLGGASLTPLIAAMYDAALDCEIPSENGPPAGFGCHTVHIGLVYDKQFIDVLDPSANYFMQRAMACLTQNGVSVVNGIGEDNVSSTNDVINYPAEIFEPWCISVGATNELDNWAEDISKQSDDLDFACPGTTSLVAAYNPGTADGQSTAFFEGTEFAAAHASGTIALLWDECAKPLHPEDVENLLEFTAEDTNEPFNPGYDNEIGHGRMNAGAALAHLNYPFNIYHREETYEASPPNQQSITEQNEAFGSFDVDYSLFPNTPIGDFNGVGRVKISKTFWIPFGGSYNILKVWGRGANASVGWAPHGLDTDEVPVNFQVGYCKLDNQQGVNGGNITLSTYALKNKIGDELTPAREDIVFAYSYLASVRNLSYYTRNNGHCYKYQPIVYIGPVIPTISPAGPTTIGGGGRPRNTPVIVNGKTVASLGFANYEGKVEPVKFQLSENLASLLSELSNHGNEIKPFLDDYAGYHDLNYAYDLMTAYWQPTLVGLITGDNYLNITTEKLQRIDEFLDELLSEDISNDLTQILKDIKGELYQLSGTNMQDVLITTHEQSDDNNIEVASLGNHYNLLQTQNTQLTLKAVLQNVSNLNISLLNVDGKEIVSKRFDTLSKGNHRLNLVYQHLPAGVYVLNISSGVENTALKFVLH